MKLILSTLIAAGLATSAVANQSDRANDLRLDAAAEQVSATEASATTQPVIVLSTRNAQKSTKPYAYTNPYGVGPSNDSR